MSIDHGKVLALVDRMERHAERLPAEAAKMLRHYIAALRALAQPAEAVAVVEAVDLGSAESVDVIEACTEAAIRESTQPSYSDESPRASWRRVVRAVLDTARNANRTDAAQGAVAALSIALGTQQGTRVTLHRTRAKEILAALTHPQAAPAQGDGGDLEQFVDGIGWVVPCRHAVEYVSKLAKSAVSIRDELAAKPLQEPQS